MSDELEQALAAHYRGANDRAAERRAEQAAARFVPDLSHERLIDASERDPSAVARLGVGLEHAMYVEARTAAIDAGRFDPAAWRTEQGIK